MKSVADGYASVKERLEAGDSEVVNRVSEMGERFMAETETARSLREIRMRHPAFDMPSFLRAVKKDVPVVIKVWCRLFLLPFELFAVFPDRLLDEFSLFATALGAQRSVS